MRDKPWFFYSLVFLGVLSMLGLWFFLHPNSPWHSREHYIIAFKEIGNLREGNVVNINGLPKGRVEGLELANKLVWVKINVLSEIKIPIDSKVRIANKGLMGERIVEITLGTSTRYYPDGSRFRGFFDMGSTSLGMLTADIFKEAGYILDVAANLVDTLSSEEKMKQYKRLEQKIKRLKNNTERVVGSAESSILQSIDSLIIAKDRTEEIINNVKPNLNNIVDNIDLLGENFRDLEKTLETLKSNVNTIAEKLEDGENTVSLAFDEKQQGSLRREMTKISKDAENLMDKIRKNGLDLNVDVF